MLFSSLLFLYAFLPLFLACYYLAPSSRRNAVALAGSIVFYVWGAPVFAAVLVGMSLLIYGFGLVIASIPREQTAIRKGVLAAALLACIGLLAWFKYANFLVAQLNGYLGWLERGSVAWREVALPLGISFFTFQKISYLVDVYRGVTPPARNLRDFLLFVLLFPQLIAGPIIRYHDIADQLAGRSHTLDRFLSGLWRFLLGLGRKVLVANSLGQVADNIFLLGPADLSAGYAWVGLLAFAFQIYFDFAGYSDMAIGLARMMGFEFMENFNRPYTARTVTDFWRRWHISLSNFMREYVYLPLGGNRAGPLRTAVNLWIVFLVSGLWHGASWKFILWGALHGLYLSVEKVIGPDRLRRVPAPVGIAITFLLVLLAWVPFQARDLAHAGRYLRALFDWEHWTLLQPPLYLARPEVISNRAVAVLVFAAVISFLPDSFWRRFRLDDPLPAGLPGALFRTGVAAACAVLASAVLAGQGYNPFIYWNF